MVPIWSHWNTVLEAVQRGGGGPQLSSEVPGRLQSVPRGGPQGHHRQVHPQRTVGATSGNQDNIRWI